MNEQRDSLREVDWKSLCPWLILVSALRLALGGRVLLLATAGLLVSTAGIIGVSKLYPDAASNAPTDDQWAVDSEWPAWEDDGEENGAGRQKLTNAVPLPDAAAISTAPIESDSARSSLRRWFFGSELIGAWRRVAGPVVQWFDRRSAGPLVYSLLCGIWTIVVWSLFGGAITRIAALYLTRGELLGPRAALGQTAPRAVSFIAAPLVPLAVILFFLALLWIPGVIATWWWGLAWAIGGVWFIAILLGFLMAIVAIGLLVGWPLMWATLSVEQTDAFDAISRSYAYVYQRPLRLLFYVAVAIGLGLAGIVVVSAFAHATIYLSDLAVGSVAGMESIPVTQSAGARFWKGLLAAFVTAFPIGFLWTASVGIYLLMRHDVDAAEMDEVAFEEQGEPGGLPNLTAHPSGVPSVDETEPLDTTSRRGDDGE